MTTFGRYQIIEQIGAGAMGAVYKARDPMMGRDVAIKTILSHAIEGPLSAEFRERFFREAQAAGRLAHPGIVTVYDVSEQDGTPFLVMEFISGRTLQSILQDGERFDTDRTCDLSIQLAEALNYAHENGVVHRDIKPANILITANGRAKIADFGVAKLAGSQVTSTGQLLGTPAFMAPEQFTGAPLDGRADIFAIGVIIYWMATGDKPFSGDSIIAVQYKVVHTDPVPPRKLNPAIPRELEAVILKSMAKDPAERYASGEELARDLRAVRTVRTAPSMSSTVKLDDTEPTLIMPSPKRTVTIAPPESRPAEPAVRQSERRRRVLFAVLVMMSFASVFGLRRIRKPAPAAAVENSVAATIPNAQPQSPPAAPAPVPPPKDTSTTVKPSAPKAAAETGVTLDLTARDKTNVIFRTEGHPMETLIMKPGNTVSLHAEKEGTLIVSNVGVLDGKLNGKPVSFGNDRKGAQFTVSAAGIVPLTGTPLTAVPGLEDAVGERGSRGSVGAPLRQKELAQSPTAVRLLIQSPGVAEFLTLMVRLDNAVLFRHDATGTPPGPIEEMRRRQLGSAPTLPLAEVRLIPPGTHKLQVSVFLGGTRLGQTQEVTADFTPGQHRTLNIQFQREGERGNPNRFTITLD